MKEELRVDVIELQNQIRCPHRSILSPLDSNRITCLICGLVWTQPANWPEHAWGSHVEELCNRVERLVAKAEETR